jgi:hypothetical protein
MRSCDGCGAYQLVVPARAFSAAVVGAAAMAGAHASQATQATAADAGRFARI